MKKTEYKFMSRWQDWLMLALLLLAIGIFVYARMAGSRVQTQDGIMSRRAVPSVMFMDETLNVELRLDAKGLPRCQVNAPPSDPVYAILVLDTSGSMAGKLDSAKAAAVEFVDLLDMDIDRVGVIQFSDAASTLTGFSGSRDGVVSGIERLAVSNSTNMGDGLQKAYQMIQGASIPQQAVRLVVLLSDGGWNTGPDPVPISQQIRSAGFRMTAIALDVPDRAYLAPLVENPDEDIISASDATQLVQSFGQIAQRYIHSLASDVKLNESYNNNAFRLVPSSARGADTQQPGMVQWSWLFLGDRGRNTGYRLWPRQMGMLRVVDNPGDMSLKDCNGQALAQPLPRDPLVLVLFPLWLLWLVVALALLWAIYRILEEIRLGRVPVDAPQPSAPPLWQKKLPVKSTGKPSPTGHWHGRQDI